MSEPVKLEYAMTHQEVTEAFSQWLQEHRRLAPGCYRMNVTMKGNAPDAVFHVALEKCDE